MTLSSINFSINSPLLHNGLLDLETQDFSKSEILLHGDWKYEGTVDEKEQFVHFPEKGNPTLGKSGTYTLRITSAKPGEFLALRTENTSGTCTLSINGKEINYIRTSLQGTDNPITNIKIYHFHVPSEDFKLTLKVSDFYVNCSDPCGGIFLYSPKRYSRMVRLKEMEDFIFQGFLFSLILIYTAMYLMGKKQKEFLFFALMNCGLSLWLLSDSQSFLDLYSLSGREDFFFRLSLIGLEIALIFSLLFIGWYKGKPYYRRLLRNATILFTTAIPLIIFLPIGVLSQYLDIARGEVLLCLSLIMTEGIQKMKKRIIIPQSLLPGFIMLTVSFIVRSFFVTPPLFSDFLLRFSLIVFVMQQFLYHTYLSLNSFNRIKELNKDYAQLNLELKDSLSRIEDQSVLIQYISSRDEITGLPNRNQFSTIFEREISNPCDKSKYLCFALVEWEDYKSFLHRKGIRVQKEVIHSFADQIRNFCTDRDWVCRYSDDRFLFMLHTEDNDKESRINKLFTTFTAPLKLKDEEYFPKINLGYTLYNGDSLTQETLLNQLFSARDYSKKQNLMAPCLYNQTIDVSLTKKALLEKKLKKALKSKILEMYYQPQHDSQNYALIGMEALLRWYES
jgi:diguanylate cyclase (GGDEF)-like protein